MVTLQERDEKVGDMIIPILPTYDLYDNGFKVCENELHPDMSRQIFMKIQILRNILKWASERQLSKICFFIHNDPRGEKNSSYTFEEFDEVLVYMKDKLKNENKVAPALLLRCNRLWNHYNPIYKKWAEEKRKFEFDRS